MKRKGDGTAAYGKSAGDDAFKEIAGQTARGISVEEAKPRGETRGSWADTDDPEEFRQLFREDWYDAFEEELKPRKPLDLSFMEAEEAEPKPVRGNIRRGRWAAVLFVCVGLTGSLTWWMNSQSAGAAKFRLKKVMHMIAEDFYTTGPAEERQDDSITLTIDDVRDLEDAERFFPELLIPEGLEENWNFDSLEIEKALSGEKTARFAYRGTGGRLSIVETVPSSREDRLPDTAENVRVRGD